MTVYFIRHGEVDNPKKIKYGRLPGFPLMARGRTEVEQTAQDLKAKGIEAIYASPLLRTKESSQILSRIWSVPIFNDDRLLEFDCGPYQGLPEAEYVAKELWKKANETPKQSGDRILDFLNEIKGRGQYKTLAVVSHEGPIVMALLNRSGKTVADYDSIKLSTGGFIEYEF